MTLSCLSLTDLFADILLNVFMDVTQLFAGVFDSVDVLVVEKNIVAEGLRDGKKKMKTVRLLIVINVVVFLTKLPDYVFVDVHQHNVNFVTRQGVEIIK